jgi:Flp pilus assembly pilin Flp
VEYALLLGLIAAVIFGIVVVVGHHVSNDFQSFTTQLTGQGGGGNQGGGGQGGGGNQGGGDQGGGGNQGGGDHGHGGHG